MPSGGVLWGQMRGDNLEGARRVTTDQLTQAKSLRDATLPDGTKLPTDDIWQEAFEEWCKTVPVDEHGFIIVDD